MKPHAPVELFLQTQPNRGLEETCPHSAEKRIRGIVFEVPGCRFNELDVYQRLGDIGAILALCPAVLTIMSPCI